MRMVAAQAALFIPHAVTVTRKKIATKNAIMSKTDRLARRGRFASTFFLFALF